MVEIFPASAKDGYATGGQRDKFFDGWGLAVHDLHLLARGSIRSAPVLLD